LASLALASAFASDSAGMAWVVAEEDGVGVDVGVASMWARVGPEVYVHGLMIARSILEVALSFWLYFWK
jgi:hypothetical protein